MEKVTIDGVDYVRAAKSEKQIVVAQRGWVYVGDVSIEGDDLVIRNAKNLRRWGTTKGLGELVNGPLPNTVADDYGTVSINVLAVVCRIDVKGGW
jgi:hypothetical protein